ncbi:DUF5810 domain-containing protein [Halobellus sp. GM3]|uniref:DUF5810 domain-containing protein n=1 Tax=Halobellus sp. GM3 TaxID=3458410 RepID=UPI00403DC7B9
MGFACPVCETPQQDATHLANHLAFTAMVHSDGHEAWLDEHAPGWASDGEDELAQRVAELAPEADYDQVFEDTAHGHGGRGTQHHHGTGHHHGRGEPGRSDGVDPEVAAATGAGTLDEEARAILEEAREMTAEMLESDSTAGEDAADDSESDAESRDSGS